MANFDNKKVDEALDNLKALLGVEDIIFIGLTPEGEDFETTSVTFISSISDDSVIADVLQQVGGSRPPSAKSKHPNLDAYIEGVESLPADVASFEKSLPPEAKAEYDALPEEKQDALKALITMVNLVSHIEHKNTLMPDNPSIQ